ncbi:hypothetical protein ACWCQZ_50490 [Streptomyces sp. NPDC002285]
MNNFDKLRRRTERRRQPVEFFIVLACVIITVRRLVDPLPVGHASSHTLHPMTHWWTL